MRNSSDHATDIGPTHRVATDATGQATFVLHAGLLSWRTFAADLATFADHHGLQFEYSSRRGPLPGLLGLEVTCAVTGRFSEVTDFAESARARIAAWRDGDVAG